MSEPKLISPLLDGFIMGGPISDHHGVRSCPAIKESTDERSIIKIISVPASQAQLDALLLTGAFSDERRAKAYFKELADDICKEATVLSRLSKLDGFLPYQSSQTVPMDDGIGYDVYLLSPYRRSLERLMRSEPLTHLAAVNLGLDMCAALAVCRRAGYLYVDLKPENIFLTQMHGYCIGDLGFLPLASLKYSSLPEKYRSRYTAPEITDAYAALNDTLDIYALGLILYQVYNNGELPTEGVASAPPMYADYEMAEIILKACASDPQERWADPAQMGQALVDYMQRNIINDDPIVPPPVAPLSEAEEEDEGFLSEEENDQELAELLAAIPDEEPPVSETPDTPSEDPPAGEAPETAEGPLRQEEPGPEVPDAETADAPPEVPEEDDTEAPREPDELPAESAEEATAADEAADSPEDEPAQEHPRTELTEDGVTTEVAEMLAQADELLLMELPEPVVAPAPIDVPIPPPIVPDPVPEDEPGPEEPEEVSQLPEEEAPAETPATAVEEAEDPEEPPAPENDTNEPEPDYDPEKQLKKRRIHGWISLAVILALLIGLGFGAYHYYQNFYLLNIDALNIAGSEDEIVVEVVTKADEAQLTVVCTDTYGNTLRSPVQDGKATFSSLNSNTQYKIHVEISGRYKLLGHTTGAYTTSAKTEILNLTAITGPENGSVILSFTIDGPDSERWKVEYSAPGIEVRTTSFVGKHITISGLDTTAEYTFRICPEDDLYMTGNDTILFTPQKLVYAQELAVESYADGAMTIVWKVPEDSQEQTWIIRCYNDAGYDQSFTTAKTSATFEGLDPSTGYTVTITAEGMTQSQTLTVSPDPIHITGFHADRTSSWAMDLSWDFTGQTPAGGWKLSYTVDGGSPIAVLCPENKTTIPLAPGATYAVEVQPAEDITFFPMSYTYGPVETERFSSHTVSASDMSLTMHAVPVEENWTADTLAAAETKTDFASSEKACLLIRLSKPYEVSDQKITTTFVIRDSNNSLVSAEETTRTWDEMWHDRKCAATIPQLPATPGTYTLDLYMQDQYVSTLTFTIT